MTHDLAAEKEAQLGKAKAVLRPLMSIVAVVVFVLCFWKFQIGLVPSLIAAALTFLAMLFGVVLPVGYILGRRAARRYKERLRDGDAPWPT